MIIHCIYDSAQPALIACFTDEKTAIILLNVLKNSSAFVGDYEIETTQLLTDDNLT